MSRSDPFVTDTPSTPLGKGGTAEVVRVFSKKHNTDIALKRPLPGQQNDAIPFAKLAAREKQLIFGQRFPGLVRILDIGVSTDDALAMELCSGPTLDKVGKVESLPLALNILSALASDLAYLQARGIIHADLKPHNFFLPADWQNQTGDKLFYAKLSDFAFGRFIDEPEAARAGLGSVGYMAPETIASSVTSHQSDLFALGIIAYQLLTGIHPFMREDADPVKVNSRIREAEPEPIEKYRSDIPATLSKLLFELLAKTPGKRPVTAWQVCERLQQCGAKYLYQRALRPVHLLKTTTTYTEMVEQTLALSEKQRGHLDLITCTQPRHLLAILHTNFRRSHLRFDGSRFRFEKDMLWPKRVKTAILRRFASLSIQQKKQHIRFAIQQYGISDGNIAQHAIELRAIGTLLFPLLSPRLIKKIAGKLAKADEQSQQLASAAHLYTLAGMLPDAVLAGNEAGSQLLLEHRNQEALHLLSRIIELAARRGEMPPVRSILMLKADILKEQGDIDPAMTVYQRIIASYEGHPPDKLLAETYKDVGDLYKMKQQVDAGIQALRRAQEIYDKLGDQLGASHTLNNIGNMYWVAVDLKSALSNYRGALHLQRELKADAEVASTLNNIGGVYAVSGRYSRAIRIYNHSLVIKKELGLGGEIARTLNNLGYVYSASGNPQQGVVCLKESLELNQRIGSKREILFNLENLGAVMIMAGRLRESLEYIQQGLELCAALEDFPRAGVLNLSKATVLKRIGFCAEAETVLTQVRTILTQIDDPNLTIETNIVEAGLRYHVGDIAAATAMSTEAFEQADKLNNMQDALNALLLLARLSDDPKVVADAEQVINDLHLNRERIILSAIILERSLQADNAAAINMKALQTLVTTVPTMNEDIELPYICQVIARALILTGDTVKAALFIDRGLPLAERSSLLPELTASVTVKGELAFQEKKYEAAFALYKRGLQFSSQISEGIKNASDKALFQKTALIQRLTEDIRRLSERLSGKKEGQPHSTRLPEQ